MSIFALMKSSQTLMCIRYVIIFSFVACASALSDFTMVVNVNYNYSVKTIHPNQSLVRKYRYIQCF